MFTAKDGNIQLSSTRLANSLDKNSPTYMLEIRLPGQAKKESKLLDLMTDVAKYNIWKPALEEGAVDVLGGSGTTLLLRTQNKYNLKRFVFNVKGK